ncbi:hypothetical protein HN371_27820 [Candidatus Poribacteria bacterium]|jgi:hypothetical protein|nr:hypothetical protein [Candidatus Poribacteria bacterium]MBT5532633.1 hypothetical protein [Candidatus Poribacteria bacterium]MBT5712379.1 hypothetical protein [Candidatus Poribacteria bacterium]MBT7096379.1 hypothetical protein [Candidatus Poribacteria bacterium]MBT7807476.1 hypothetical protein [Candidatus Poribacteria bacterium]
MHPRFRTWLAATATLAVAAVGVGTFLIARSGTAQVQLVTVPGRDTVELTIYRSEDLTFAKEQRNITLREGSNLIQFSWAGTRIDPTSAQLKSVSDPANVQVLEAIYPKNLENAILWRVESTTAGAHVVEVSYFIQGLTWRADYMAYVNGRETQLRLQGAFTVGNSSGEDYEGATARLVVGDIHLVPAPQLREMLRQEGGRRAAKGARRYAGYAADAQVLGDRVGAGQSLAEYYMYTIAGENTVDSGWTKKVTAFDTPDVPVEVVYRYEPGQNVVRRLYTFTNDPDHALGVEPLPAGEVRVFMVDDAGQVSFIGQNSIEFSPVSKEIKLDLGPELAVEVERSQMDFARMNLAYNDDGDVSHFDTEEEMRIEARNFRPESVRLEIPERINGQWEMLNSTEEFEPKDANTIQYTLDIGPGETKTITYRVRHLGR